MAIRFIALTCGYVENARTSWLIYGCEFFGNPGYSSHKEAITDLALDMYAKYYDDYLSTYENRYSMDVKSCCREVLIKDKTASFCSTCGGRITDRKFNYDQFMKYVDDLHDSTCDSYGDAEDTSTRNLTWWPWASNFIGAPKEDVIHIAENAEVVLLAALLEAKPELVDEKSGFRGSNDWEQLKTKK